MRIISLVPSVTFSLLDLGLPVGQLVGRTKFCISPKNLLSTCPVVGGTKSLKLEVIARLKPDLILANKEENTREEIEALSKDFNVWTSEVSSLEDNSKFLLELGHRIGRSTNAQSFVKEIESIFDRPWERKQMATYLIWQNPLMAAGGDTFISDVLNSLNIPNALGTKKRYPTLENNDLDEIPNILLSSEPYPFSENHRIQMQNRYQKSNLVLCDGQAFSWHGTFPRHCREYYRRFIQQLL